MKKIRLMVWIWIFLVPLVTGCVKMERNSPFVGEVFEPTSTSFTGETEARFTATPSQEAAATKSIVQLVPTMSLPLTATVSSTQESRWQCDPSGGLACGQFIIYISMVSETEGWMVSSPGYKLYFAYHYFASPGETEPSWHPASMEELGVPEGYFTSPRFMFSETEGWEVGNKGRISRLVDGKWQDVPSPTEERLLDIVMLNETDGWIVGDYGTLLHYIDGQWVQVPLSIQYSKYQNPSLYDIEMVNDDEGWIVGDTILHYRDGVWRDVPNPLGVQNFLSKLSMVNAKEGWAVGNWGLMVHYVDDEWQIVDSPTEQSLSAVDMVNAEDGWAVGWNSTVLRYQHGNWEIVSEVAFDGWDGLNDLSWLGEDEGWASATLGRTYHYRNGNWNLVETPTEANLWGIDMITAEEGWAVGHDGVVLHYVHGKWVPEDSSVSQSLHDVDMINEKEGWAVGGGVIIHYLDYEWRQADCPSDNLLTAVKMINIDEGWAVGEKGTVLHYKNGIWQEIPPFTDQYLKGIDITDSSNIWIWSGRTIWRSQNGIFEEVTLPKENMLRAINTVDMLDSNDGWIIVDEGAVQYHDGQWYRAQKLPTRPFYSAMVMVDEGEGWAVGSSGILHYTNK